MNHQNHRHCSYLSQRNLSPVILPVGHWRRNTASRWPREAQGIVTYLLDATWWRLDGDLMSFCFLERRTEAALAAEVGAKARWIGLHAVLAVSVKPPCFRNRSNDSIKQSCKTWTSSNSTKQSYQRTLLWLGSVNIVRSWRKSWILILSCSCSCSYLWAKCS